ncbi:lytic transglycosylase domain-containing protein [Kozakia baliensis]|uniref:lytic transglycosylase domain-containing protein n=1 Tax=Kozakia baliensis TaxID=153496 RepID=UPI00345B6A2E
MSRLKRFSYVGLLLLSCCSHQAGSAPNAEPVASIPVSGASTSNFSENPAISARLANWLRLTQPDPTIPARDYAAFLQEQPAWPGRAVMLARFQHALVTRTDDDELSSLCSLFPLTQAQALLKCADRIADASVQARRLWMNGGISLSDETPFLARFGQAFSLADHWTRFEHLEATHQYTAASHQISRLALSKQALARAFLAYRTTSPEADALFMGLSPTDQRDPALTFARLHHLRRADQLGDALALWNAVGLAAQQSAPSSAWSIERAGLARALLSAGSPQDAIILADDRTLPLTNANRLEAQFLSGWIALRRLHDAQRAEAYFLPLTTQPSLITRSRGYYWIGRAQEAAGQKEAAQASYRQAAAMPTTFYGQMALSALNGDVATLPPQGAPVPHLAEALNALPIVATGTLARPDLAQAAQELVGMQDQDHAREFLMMLYVQTRDVAGQAALAQFSLQLGVPEPAVFATRAAGKKGVALYPQGWPSLSDIREESVGLPESLALAVARQESSFDPHAQSPAQAIGLMQLQTGTAQDVARRAGLIGLDTSISGLRDPQTNLTLGRAYLSQLLDRYNQVLPMALSAYNAGPHRTDQWLQADPPPTIPTQIDLVDWIESLPYEETRSYIERIEESLNLYRLKESSHA